jgi:hypothetical protein
MGQQRGGRVLVKVEHRDAGDPDQRAIGRFLQHDAVALGLSLRALRDLQRRRQELELPESVEDGAIIGPLDEHLDPMRVRHKRRENADRGRFRAGFEMYAASGYTSHDLWEAIVNKPSIDDPALMLVVPGHPELSFLYTKVVAGASKGSFVGTACSPPPSGNATCGSAMPPVGEALSAGQLAQIQNWIAQGALDN